MEVLEAHPNSVAGLRKTLESLPSGLDAMHEQTFARILDASEDDFVIARRALIWMAYGRERDGLTVEDFQIAVSTSFEKGSYDPDDLVPMELILGACCGLVEVPDTKVFNGRSYAYEARLVRECRFSARAPASFSRLTVHRLLNSRVHSSEYWLLRHSVTSCSDIRYLLDPCEPTHGISPKFPGPRLEHPLRLAR